MWNHSGQQRPPFALERGPGEESVWDYPRPPALLRDSRLVNVQDGDSVIATTTASYRVLETASPPTFYIPDDDIDWEHLTEVSGNSVCEWKGMAKYWALRRDPDVPVAWAYPRPKPRFDAIKNFLAFYPGRVACFVDNERVQAQAGKFYGGWITSEIIGPFKGDPGTGHW